MGRKARKASGSAPAASAPSSSATIRPTDTTPTEPNGTNHHKKAQGTTSKSSSVPQVTPIPANDAAGANALEASDQSASLAAAQNGTSASKPQRGFLAPRRCWRVVQGPLLVVGCMMAGGLLGFWIGTGWGLDTLIATAAHRNHSHQQNQLPLNNKSQQLHRTTPSHAPTHNWTANGTAGKSATVSAGLWKQALANRVRSTSAYQLLTLQGPIWDAILNRVADWAESVERDLEAEQYAQNPSHPRVFAVLRESIVREEGGYVHPDLGFLVPAPSGAARGVGMVRNSYHNCQVTCLPGTVQEKDDYERDKSEAARTNATLPFPPILSRPYRQQEVLIKVPLAAQMTRHLALETLLALVPADVQRAAPLEDLDDSVLLALHLAHERGLGRASQWVSYVASLPPQPSCGYSLEVRPHILDAVAAYRDELGLDVQGWPTELVRATQYADRIVDNLHQDYGPYLKSPPGVSMFANLQWSLCQVASRAFAGSSKYGALRMVPMVDLLNHDFSAAGILELTGNERFDKGDVVTATSEEADRGAFVIRSTRLGRRRPLGVGQELLINYNVPSYSPLDWMVNMGFVPPERWGKWQKIDPVLPRVRTDGPFGAPRQPTPEEEEARQKVEEAIIEQLKALDL